MNGNGQKGLSYRLTHPLWKISGYATGLSQLSTASAACGSRQVFCWAPRGQQIDRSIAGAGAQQQRRSSTALSRKCGMRTVSYYYYYYYAAFNAPYVGHKMTNRSRR